MTELKKGVKFLNKITDSSILIVCLILFLLGLYALIDSYLVFADANNTDILKYKPGYENLTDDDRPIKGRMVAWLTVDDTTIDYPVMQGSDNIEYLNKDPFGDYSLSGSIFLDSRNTPDFSDMYSLIYGHHMNHGGMFGALDDFLKKDFFDSHKYGELYVGEEIYRIALFAVSEPDATDEVVFDPTHEDDILEYIEDNHVFFREGIVKTGKEKIIALSTCKYPDSTERTVVFGVLRKNADSKKEST